MWAKRTDNIPQSTAKVATDACLDAQICRALIIGKESEKCLVALG